MKPTQQLHELGQSIWLDNITRALLTSGTLKRYIDDLLTRGTFELGYEERPFIGAGLRMKVEMESKWLAADI